MVVFTSEVSQNEYLPEGGREVHAVVTVTAADGDAGSRAAAEAAEVIIIDCSGSMDYPRKKIVEARRAARTAIDTLRDGTWFAVVEGAGSARVVYPTNTFGLVAASDETRAAAKQAVDRLHPNGGTALGRWLTLARDLMATRPNAIHHAILLTDGKNEGESEHDFAAALAACEGQFQCDCRGIGEGWVVPELRRVSTTLLGSLELLREPEQLAGDFRSVIEAAMGRSVDRVGLRVWTPKGAAVRYLHQVSPEYDDLSGRAVPVNPLTRDYPTGAWGVGSRDYHLCVDVLPGPVGAEKLAARVSLVVGDEVHSSALVRAVWTEDVDLSTRIDGTVAHYTGQAELARAVQDGLEAKRTGDEDTATTLLGRAAQLAAEADDEATLQRLAKVVDIDDVATGTVRIRKVVERLDEMDLDASSTKTIPAKR